MFCNEITKQVGLQILRKNAVSSFSSHEPEIFAHNRDHL